MAGRWPFSRKKATFNEPTLDKQGRPVPKGGIKKPKSKPKPTAKAPSSNTPTWVDKLTQTNYNTADQKAAARAKALKEKSKPAKKKPAKKNSKDKLKR